MNKLLDLLNEREEEVKSSKIKWKIDYNPVGIYGYVGDYGLGFASKMIIISKEYGFIKWLVEKDKIDYKKLHGEEWYLPLVDMVKFNGSKRLEVLLMLLAIQENSIEFLISILK